MRVIRGFVATIGLLALLAPSARSQAVAFIPTPAIVPDGVSMNVVPVASADRRYVRVSVNPNFYGFVGFSVFPVPGAVSGGPNGGVGGIGGGAAGAIGGAGGLGAGGGAAGGAVGQAGLGNFDVGMDGLAYPATPMQPYAPMSGAGQGEFSFVSNMPPGQYEAMQRASAVSRQPQARTTKTKVKKAPAKAKLKAKATSTPPAPATAPVVTTDQPANKP